MLLSIKRFVICLPIRYPSARKNFCQDIYFYIGIRLPLTFSLGPTDSLEIFFADRGNPYDFQHKKIKLKGVSYCRTQRVYYLFPQSHYTRNYKESDIGYQLKLCTRKKNRYISATYKIVKTATLTFV